MGKAQIVIGILLSIALLNLSACAPVERPTEDTVAEVTPPTSLNITEAKVTRVIDGDTIEVDINGIIYKVRYIGIDTPEAGQPCANEATQKNHDFVEGKIVRLEKDVSETDEYGRLLRYIYVDSPSIKELIDMYGTSLQETRELVYLLSLVKGKPYLFVNALLVALGYAQVYTFPPDVKYQDYFFELQREAKEASRGCWGIETTETYDKADKASEFFIEIVSVTSPVSAGAYATIEIKTVPNELLGIEVYYKSGKSEAQGLHPKCADDDGDITWTWKVGTRTTPGHWKIVVASLNMDWWFKGYENITKTVYFEVR